MYANNLHVIAKALLIFEIFGEFLKVFEWIENDGSAYLEKPVELAESYSHAISQHNSLEKFINLAKVTKKDYLYRAGQKKKKKCLYLLNALLCYIIPFVLF